MGEHSPFVVGLFDHDDVGKLGGICDFSNEVCIEEFVHFFFDSFASFFSHLPFLLLYRFVLGIDHNFVADNAGMDSQHVKWLPSK